MFGVKVGLLAAYGLSQVSGMQLQDLSGPGWTLHNINGNIQLPSAVPSYALEVLQEHGVIGDPLFRYGELEYRWVAEDGWSWTRSFEAHSSLLSEEAVLLSLTGVDTVAEVRVNGQLAGACNNGFRQHVLDVKRLLLPGNNSLDISIRPAAAEAVRRAQAYPYEVPTMELAGQLPHWNFLRKPQSDFGWDWGPAFAAAGIYGRVQLEGHSTAYMTSLNVRQQHHGNGTATLSFDAVIDAVSSGQEGSLKAICQERGEWTAEKRVLLHKPGPQQVTLQLSLDPPFDLWWPSGYGPQPLYNFTVSFVPAGEAAGCAAAAQADSSAAAGGATWGEARGTTLHRRVGLRHAQLCRDEAPGGQLFYFRVNGVPVFVKGANMITADILPTRATAQLYSALVSSAAAAHMNMLRVWGGGIYPPQEFLDACDELGIMVWMEAVFACSVYPRDAAFLQEVKQEVQYQMRRVNWHPSVMIWGGNNEIETATATWLPDVTKRNERLYIADYVALFLDTVRPAVAEVDPAIPFVDSSPSNGLLSMEPYVKRWGDAQSDLFGDIHHYDYKNNAFDPTIYPKPRFVSEFGFQSLPSFPAYKTQTQQQDWSRAAPMSDFRMRHPNGSQELLDQARRHFHVPAAAPAGPDSPEQSRLFRLWTYLTQAQQMLAYHAAIGHWRRLKGVPDVRTMGVLYWQLNDVWAGASWSSMDSTGRWRLLHHGLRRVFAPVIVSGYWEQSDDTVRIWVVNDLNQPIKGAVKLEVINMVTLNRTVTQGPLIFLLEALEARQLLAAPIQQAVADACGGCVRSSCFLQLSLDWSVAGSTSRDPPSAGRLHPAAGAAAQQAAAAGLLHADVLNDLSAQPGHAVDHVWLAEFKDMPVHQQPGVRVTAAKLLHARLVQLELQAAQLALLVALETDAAGQWSDNGFVLAPIQPRTLAFEAEAEVGSLQDFVASLSITSLADTVPAADRDTACTAAM